jgi:glutamine synthetase
MGRSPDSICTAQCAAPGLTFEGWRPVVAPELEFTLWPATPTVPYCADWPQWLMPRLRAARLTAMQSMSLTLFEDVYDYCDKDAARNYTLIHEVGADQMESIFMPPLDGG